MENIIVMADTVGATVHDVDSNNAVIIFNESQLNAFVNQVVLEVGKDLLQTLEKING